MAVPSGDTGQPPEDLLLWAGGSEGQGAASASPPRAFQSPSLCGAGQGAGYTRNSCPRHLLRPSELLAQHLGDTTKNTLVAESGIYEHPARSPLSWATPRQGTYFSAPQIQLDAEASTGSFGVVGRASAWDISGPQKAAGEPKWGSTLEPTEFSRGESGSTWVPFLGISDSRGPSSLHREPGS